MNDQLTIDPLQTAVVVVDVQRLFTDLFRTLVSPPLTEVLPNMTRFLAEARNVGASIFLVRTVVAPEGHSRNTLQWPEYMRRHLSPGSAGTEWDPAIAPHEGDIEIVKQRYSSFFGTELDAMLRERKIQTVLIFGLTTDVCVQSTVRDAWQLDYQTITLSDCCSDPRDDSHVSALARIVRNFGSVCSSSEILANWHMRD